MCYLCPQKPIVGHCALWLTAWKNTKTLINNKTSLNNFIKIKSKKHVNNLKKLIIKINSKKSIKKKNLT